MAALLLLTCSLGTARAADPTDSILTYGCDPPLPRTATNCATWHTSPVSLRWTLIDPNFTPVLGSSCDTTFVDKDTKGTGVTCAVQDAGLTKVQKTVTLRVDQTAPTVTGATARPADHGGWWNHPVTIVFSGADPTSGLDGCDTVAYSGPDDPAADVTGGCRDVAGNSATRHVAVKYDANPPTLSALPADVGSNEAVVHWVASPDAVLTEVTRSPGIGEAPASTVYSGTDQTFSDPSVTNDVTYTYSIRASDAAANRASATVVVTPTAEPAPQPEAAPAPAPPPRRRVAGEQSHRRGCTGGA